MAIEPGLPLAAKLKAIDLAVAEHTASATAARVERDWETVVSHEDAARALRRLRRTLETRS